MKHLRVFMVKKWGLAVLHETFLRVLHETNVSLCFHVAGKTVLELFETAAGAKGWNCFTKAQRKSITQWKESAMVRTDHVGVVSGCGW